MADVLTRTARQVRLDGATVHRLLGEPYITPFGRQYRTVCNKTLSAAEGAILTTHDAGCTGCQNGGMTKVSGLRKLLADSAP